MYVIKHHNKFQSDIPSDLVISEKWPKKVILTFFAKRRLGADADADT